MESNNKVEADRHAAINDMRTKLNQCAIEYERLTGQTVTRLEAHHKGSDWALQLDTINAVAAIDSKRFG
jgi:hypothetical protein